MARGSRKAASGRGSAEAIEKRRVARQLNTLFSAGGKQAGKLDGRTEKRRQRLLKELKEGKRGEPLKAIELMSHANELLELGESVASIKKNGVKLPKFQLDEDGESRELIARAQEAYDFRPEAWKLLGVDVSSTPATKVPKATKAKATKTKATKRGRRKTSSRTR